MTNIRGELENALRAPIADAAWDHLVQQAYIEEVEAGAWTIDDLTAKVRDSSSVLRASPQFDQ
jgi:hypothetical protein